MKKLKFRCLKMFLLLALFCAITVTAYAAIPHLINYQGRLTDTSGTPLNGLYNLTFRIYDAESAGNLLWQGTYSSIQINKGIFNIFLGDVSDAGYDFASLAFNRPYWLEIKVGDEVMNPRQRIASAGYAITAENGVPRGVIVMWSGSIADIPLGWALCDGTNSTPDLRDRFVIGARQDDGVAKTNLTGSLTQSGGATTMTGVSGSHALTISEMPAHTHSYSVSDNYGGAGGGGGPRANNTNGTTGSTGGSAGHIHTTEIPPYYALAFIMKL